MSVAVTTLSTTPVKGTRLRTVERIDLGPSGATGDRAFYVVDERGRMLNAKVLGELHRVVSELVAGRLRLTFPDGTVSEGEVGTGEPIQTRFYSLTREDRAPSGPWSAALSEYLERPVTLVESLGPESAIDRGTEGAVSLISRGSLERLATEAAVPSIDARRFRMLIEIDGIRAHDEDGWVGRRVQVGAALVRFRGHVGRCLITSREPETGVIDLPTLEVLGSYRTNLETTEPLPFGIYGEVLEPGPVAVGDPVRSVG